GSALPVCALSGSPVASLDENLTVFGDAHPHAGKRSSDRAHSVVLRRVTGGGSAYLGLAIEFDDREPDRVQPAQKIGMDGGGRSDEDVGPVETDLPTDPRAQGRVEHCVRHGLPRRQTPSRLAFNLETPAQ